MISLIKKNWKILRKHKNRVDIERNEGGKSKDYNDNDDDGREDGIMYWFAFFYLIFVYPTTYRSYLLLILPLHSLPILLYQPPSEEEEES
jgi:hypothetical protein